MSMPNESNARELQIADDIRFAVATLNIMLRRATDANIDVRVSLEKRMSMDMGVEYKERVFYAAVDVKLMKEL
jgi:hypothetical protein